MSRAVPICHRTRGAEYPPPAGTNHLVTGGPCIGSVCSAVRWYPGDHLIFCGLVFPAPSLPPEGACWEDPAKPATVREGGGG